MFCYLADFPRKIFCDKNFSWSPCMFCHVPYHVDFMHNEGHK